MDISSGCIGRFSMDLVLLIQRDFYILTLTLHEMQFYWNLYTYTKLLCLTFISFAWKTSLCPLPQMGHRNSSDITTTLSERIFLWWYFFFFTLWASDRPAMMRMCDPLFAELSEPSLRVSSGIPLSLKLEPSEKKHEPRVQTARPTALTTAQLGPVQLFILQSSDLRTRFCVMIAKRAGHFVSNVYWNWYDKFNILLIDGAFVFVVLSG